MEESHCLWKIVLAVLQVAGSLGLFIYGMKIMAEALQRIGSGYIRRRFSAAASGSLVRRIVSGTLVTALVQSSTAATATIVSFVNAGVITLRQSAGFIMGANIGTTVTAWLVALLAFREGFGVLSVSLVGIGLPLFFSRREGVKSTGESIIGLALLFIGVDFLERVIGHNTGSGWHLFFTGMADGGIGPVLLMVLIGTAVTVLIRSSSAAVALTIVLCYMGWIGFDCAAAMVIGNNIGTTFPVNRAARVVNSDARRSARIHLMFNAIGAVWALLLFVPATAFVEWLCLATGAGSPSSDPSAAPVALALFHTLFNVANVILLSGWSGQLVKWSGRLVRREADSKTKLRHIDAGVMPVSEISILQAQNELQQYARRSRKMFGFVREMFAETDGHRIESLFDRIRKYEQISDRTEEEIDDYLGEASRGDLGTRTAASIQLMSKLINDIESIADLNYGVAKILRRKRDESLWFGPAMREQAAGMMELIDNGLAVMEENLSDLENECLSIASALEIEQKVNSLRNQIKEGIAPDEQQPEISYDAMLLFSELITELEQVADAVVKVSEDLFQSIEKQ